MEVIRLGEKRYMHTYISYWLGKVTWKLETSYTIENTIKVFIKANLPTYLKVLNVLYL